MRKLVAMIMGFALCPGVEAAGVWQDINFVNKHLALKDWQSGGLVSTWPLQAHPKTPLPRIRLALSDDVDYAGFVNHSYAEDGISTAYYHSYRDWDFGIDLHLYETSDTHFLSGSYLRWRLGNWYVSAESTERWWGPSWSGSLILGNASEPVPGISLQRRQFHSFSNKYLSWLGPWNLLLFAGQLEKDRHVPEAKLLAMRFSFSPWKRLEFGINRTAQWGGEGRPQDLASLGRLLFGLDNVGSNGVNADNQPGNQLAGFDMYWQVLPSKPLAVYSQVVGEDEANLFPTAFIGLYGFETWLGSHYRAFLEYADTRVDYYRSERRYNVAYEHSVYQSGYTYNGLSLAHSMGGDGQMTSLGQMWVQKNGSSYLLVLRSVRPDVINPLAKNRRSLMLSGLWNMKAHGLRIDTEWYQESHRVTGEKDSDVVLSIRWTMDFN